MGGTRLKNHNKRTQLLNYPYFVPLLFELIYTSIFRVVSAYCIIASYASRCNMGLSFSSDALELSALFLDPNRYAELPDGWITSTSGTGVLREVRRALLLHVPQMDFSGGNLRTRLGAFAVECRTYLSARLGKPSGPMFFRILLRRPGQQQRGDPGCILPHHSKARKSAISKVPAAAISRMRLLLSPVICLVDSPNPPIPPIEIPPGLKLVDFLRNSKPDGLDRPSKPPKESARGVGCSFPTLAVSGPYPELRSPTSHREFSTGRFFLNPLRSSSADPPSSIYCSATVPAGRRYFSLRMYIRSGARTYHSQAPMSTSPYFSESCQKNGYEMN